MPKIDLDRAPRRTGLTYPEPFRTQVGQMERVALARAAGLTALGVNLLTLAPGQMSALRHWHEREDEFVYVLEGAPVLVEDAGETVLGPGDAAGFPAGLANAHHLMNRGDAPARVLEIGPRLPDERGHYPDVDLAFVREGGQGRFSSRGGPAPAAGRPIAGTARIDVARAPVRTGSDYPAPMEAEFRDRLRRRLGDAAGLTQFGVNLTTLPPGARSSLRHWHEVEDEMVWVLEGSLLLVEDTGTSQIGPGEAAGFPGGAANAHHFENRGKGPALYLEIGTRPGADRCHYADHDLICHDGDGRTWFTRRDGTPVETPKELEA